MGGFHRTEKFRFLLPFPVIPHFFPPKQRSAKKDENGQKT